MKCCKRNPKCFGQLFIFELPKQRTRTRTRTPWDAGMLCHIFLLFVCFLQLLVCLLHLLSAIVCVLHLLVCLSFTFAHSNIYIYSLLLIYIIKLFLQCMFVLFHLFFVFSSSVACVAWVEWVALSCIDWYCSCNPAVGSMKSKKNGCFADG